MGLLLCLVGYTLYAYTAKKSTSLHDARSCISQCSSKIGLRLLAEFITSPVVLCFPLNSYIAFSVYRLWYMMVVVFSLKLGYPQYLLQVQGIECDITDG